MADSSYANDAAVLDGTAAAAGTAPVNIVGGIFNDSIADIGTGNAGAVRLTSDRAMHVNLRNASGVDMSITEDTAVPANTVGYAAMGRASSISPSPPTGDEYWMPLWLSPYGALNVQVRDLSGAYGLPDRRGEDTSFGAVGAVPYYGWPPMFRSSSALPANTSADNDAVIPWASRFGALNVILRDTSGNYASAAGSTQYVEDVAFGGNGTGTLALARRDDALAVLTPVEDDAVGLRVNNRGALWVGIVDGSGNLVTSFGGGTTYTEDAALGAVGSALGGMTIARASASAPTSVSADADAVSLWASRFGALNVILRDTAGAAVATGTQYTEDAAITANAGVGTLVVARRDDALSALTPAEDDAVGLRVNSVGALWVAGADTYANDAAMGATPIGGAIAGRASTAVPTAVGADGDAVMLWASRKGSLISAHAPHVGLAGDPWTLASKTAQYTSTQTSAVLQAGAAGETIVVTKVQIQAAGTTAGALQVYFGTGAYSRGTSRAIFDGEFAPSSTLKPGVVMNGPFIAGATGDDVLVTTSAAMTVTVTVWYYIVT